MHARPEIREILIIQKLKRWAMIAKYNFVDPTCSAARARRNFHRLCARHPEIAAKLGMTAVSVYEP